MCLDFNKKKKNSFGTMIEKKTSLLIRSGKKYPQTFSHLGPKNNIY